MTAEETGSAGASAASGEGVTESLSLGTGSQPDTRPRCDSTSADIASRKALDAIVASHYDEQHSHSVTAEQTDLLIALWKDELEQLETAYKQALIRSKNEEKRLTALVVSERERADAWQNGHSTLNQEIMELAEQLGNEAERADKAEQERDEALQAARDGGWEMSSEEEVRHLAGMLESQNLMTVEAEALVVSERERADRAEHLMECADTPLMRDVLARAERAETALRDLLSAAEDECGPKTTTPDKDAEYWATQKIGASMPGVDRRIILARSVIAARAALSGLADDTRSAVPECEATPTQSGALLEGNDRGTGAAEHPAGLACDTQEHGT